MTGSPDQLGLGFQPVGYALEPHRRGGEVALGIALGLSMLAEEIHFSLYEFSLACGVPEGEVRAWVLEGVLEPSGANPAGNNPDDWEFTGSSIRRARTAYRLSRDLEVNLAGLALALDLLDEIASLQARLDALKAFDGPRLEKSSD